jgi:tryptophanyl-tRNA synthetase
MKSTNIVLSGIQPSGELHIGNYLAAIKNWVELQDKYPCYFFIADYHSLTEIYNPKEKLGQIYDLAVDLLALGLDPKKSTIFIQSHIPECTELAWIFNTITPISYLERMTQFKDKAEKQKENINVGLFDYPVLQAADILLYKANLVPVGQDQVQHVELTRDIARFFNRRFGETFVEPKPILTPTPKIMSLVEPEKKMSKSTGPDHYIGINDSPEVIREKLKKAVTGMGTEDKPSAGAQNLLKLLKEFGAENEYKKFRKTQDNKTIKYSELKKTLAEVISIYFEPFREERKKLAKKPNYIKKVLEGGTKKASKVAKETLLEVKKKIGVL